MMGLQAGIALMALVSLHPYLLRSQQKPAYAIATFIVVTSCAGCFPALVFTRERMLFSIAFSLFLIYLSVLPKVHGGVRRAGPGVDGARLLRHVRFRLGAKHYALCLDRRRAWGTGRRARAGTRFAGLALRPRRGGRGAVRAACALAHQRSDVLLPGAAAAVRCPQEHPDAALAYCDFNLIDPNSAVVRRVRAPDFDYRRMVVEIECPPGPGAFFRRSAFEKAGTWNPRFKQMLDYEYWLRLGLHGRFVRIPKVLAAYRVHPGSQSFAASHQIRPREPITIVESYFANAELPAEILAAERQALGTAHLLSAQLHLKIGNYGEGVATLFRAFRLKPRSLVSVRILRMIANALFNRVGHGLLWTFRRVLSSRSR